MGSFWAALCRGFQHTKVERQHHAATIEAADKALDRAEREATLARKKLAVGVVALDRTKVEAKETLQAIETLVREIRGSARPPGKLKNGTS